MAEQMFMFATTAGFIIGLGVLLFVVRGRRSKGVKATIPGHDEGDKGGKVKSFDSDGKPVYNKNVTIYNPHPKALSLISQDLF